MDCCGGYLKCFIAVNGGRRFLEMNSSEDVIVVYVVCIIVVDLVNGAFLAVTISGRSGGWL